MSGPHPATAAARRAVRDTLNQADIGAGSRLLLAVSGGSDSMALAAAALFVSRHDGLLIDTITVDHGLRPESVDEARAVAAQLENMGVSRAHVARVNGADAAATAGPEGTARAARYAAIAHQAQEGTAAVLLGHTADDQAETVLLGLARGSGARSIRGMLPIGPLPEYPGIRALRPLLGMRRADLRAGLTSAGIAWWDDPTNEPTSPWRAKDGTQLRRSAVRSHALRALEEDLGSGVVKNLARTAQLLQADDEALTSWAAREREGLGREPDIKKLRGLPAAVRTRILRALALEAGARAGELVGWHIDHLDELVTGPGGARGIDLPGVRAVQSGGRITFEGLGLDRSRNDENGKGRDGRD
ncbi:MAG: tRNA lysidine(34) synthetase TilS [Ancrocorticia sp.]|uniref:tRNA lysidine(34) synthetase TilS n=1 Tax=Ancrocorticia sp. TaxID=2593684 RepID=UPI003F910295